MIALAALLAVSLQGADLPDCADSELGPRVNCVLEASDGSAWRLVFDYQPEGPQAQTVTVLMVSVDGAPVERRTYGLERGFLAPELVDLDGDGWQDLLVPLSTGLVNSDWRIAFGRGDGYGDAQGEPVNGHTLKPAGEGLFAVHARSSAVRHVVTIYARDGLALTSQAVLGIGFDEDGAVCRLEGAADDRGEAFYCGLALTD